MAALKKDVFAVIGKSISILHYQKQGNVAAIMAPYGLRSLSYGFLCNLIDREGITQRELCAILNVDEALASRAMGTLVKKGFIIRERSKMDARSYELYLTGKARAIIPELLESYEKWWKQLCKGFPAEEMEILCSRLREMVERTTGRDLYLPEKTTA
jgi:DNA-binding MarR family transcriptional regulator